MTTAPIVVGALGRSRTARIDAVGAISFDDAGWVLRWWVGADDRWRDPAAEAAVRQRRVRAAPVAETRLRVPGGDAVQVVSSAGERLVVEVRNESPAPFVVAFDVGPGPGGAVRSIEVEDAVVVVDGLAAIELPRAPLRWTAGPDAGTRWEAVVEGGAETGPVRPAVDRAGGAGVALLFPVAHRASVTATVPLEPTRRVERTSRSLPDPDAIARGWRSQLDVGLRVELPDPAWQELLDAARATLLLLAGPGRRLTPEAVAALEDWGHDREALAGWARLGWRERRRARRRGALRSGELERLRRAASPVGTWPKGPAPFLVALRAVLARDAVPGSVEVLGELPREWLGGPLSVRHAPTRAGVVSYTVRWHGARPALLWECDPGVELRAPGLDRSWSTREPRGEALLSPSGEA